MTEAWNETLADRLHDELGTPVPREQLPAGAVCVLTADGSPPTAEELEEIDQFRKFLRLKQEIGQEAAWAAVYGQETSK